MGLADEVAANIRAARKARKLSLQKLAAKVSRSGENAVHHTTISRLEDGERGLTLDWLERIAAALEMDPVELLTGQSSVWQGFALSAQVADEVAKVQANILSHCAGMRALP